jgi:type IV fimbrial biogenesis protein FimT
MLLPAHKLPGAFTLLELLIALLVVATISLFAIPSFNHLFSSIRMHSNLNSLIHTFYTARQHTLASGIPTAVCRSSDAQQCIGNGDWAVGWLVFANRDNDDPPMLDPGETVLRVQNALPEMRISANRRAFIQRPADIRSTNGTFTWCDRRGAKYARALIVSYTGKPRLSETNANGSALSCN